MSVLHVSLFGVVAALVVGGADYAMTMKKQEGQDYSLLDHIAFRASQMTATAEAEEAPEKVVVCAQKGAAKFCSSNN